MTQNTMARTILAALMAICVSATAAYAEHVFLKDGKIVQGKITIDKKDSVTLTLPDSTQKVIARADILRILYSDDFLTKSLVQLTNGENFEGFIVQEKRTELTIRKKLSEPVEQVIPKDQIQLTTKKRPSQLAARLITGGFTLKWSKPVGSLKKFVVYMKKEGEEYKAAGESVKPELQIRKGIQEGTAYKFIVRLVDEDNYESPPSNEITPTSLKKGEAPPVYEDEVKKTEEPKKKEEDKFSLALGPYGTGSIGLQYWNNKSGQVGGAGGGIMFDTAAARDTLLNMRTTVAFSQNWDYRYSRRPLLFIIPNFPIPGYGTADIYQTKYYRAKDMVKPYSIDLSEAFGFGVVRTPVVRFWLGPEYVLKLITTGSKKYLSVSTGLGLVLGLNINLGSLITLTFSGACRALYSYRYTEYTTIDTSDFVPGSFAPPLPVPYVLPDPRVKKHDQDNGIGISGVLNIGVLFRINDTYSPATK
jgi:hypothetical protein